MRIYLGPPEVFALFVLLVIGLLFLWNYTDDSIVKFAAQFFLIPAIGGASMLGLILLRE